MMEDEDEDEDDILTGTGTGTGIGMDVGNAAQHLCPHSPNLPFNPIQENVKSQTHATHT